MDMRDKEFDYWIKSSLNTEIGLNKQNRQAVWEQIQANATQTTINFAFEEDYNRITSPVASHEPLHSRVLQWVVYFFTQENNYQKAHDNSVHYYKAKPNYCSGLTLHDLELMRHRWTCPV